MMQRTANSNLARKARWPILIVVAAREICGLEDHRNQILCAGSDINRIGQRQLKVPTVPDNQISRRNPRRTKG
jgi:hypothetical protein